MLGLVDLSFDLHREIASYRVLYQLVDEATNPHEVKIGDRYLTNEEKKAYCQYIEKLLKKPLQLLIQANIRLIRKVGDTRSIILASTFVEQEREKRALLASRDRITNEQKFALKAYDPKRPRS